MGYLLRGEDEGGSCEIRVLVEDWTVDAGWLGVKAWLFLGRLTTKGYLQVLRLESVLTFGTKGKVMASTLAFLALLVLRHLPKLFNHYSSFPHFDPLHRSSSPHRLSRTSPETSTRQKRSRMETKLSAKR